MSEPTTVALRLAKETARRFAKASLRPLAVQRQTLTQLPSKVCSAHSELGLGIAGLPESVGGLGMGPLATCLIAEALASGDINSAFALPQPGPFADLVALLGNRHQKKIWLHPFLHLPQSTRGALLVGGHGSFRARIEDDCLHVQGGISAAWGASQADRFVVVANLVDAHGQPSANRRVFVLPRDHEGLSIAPPISTPGLQLTPLSPVLLRDVRVPKSQWLQGDGTQPGGTDVDAPLRQMFTLQALRMGSYALGAARAASKYVLNFAEKRRQAGKPLAHFHSMGFLLVDMHLACEAAFTRLREAAAAPKLDEAEIARARAAADEVAFFVTDSAMQILADDVADKTVHPVAAWHQDIQLLAQSYRADAYLAPGMQAAAPAGSLGWLC